MMMYWLRTKKILLVKTWLFTMKLYTPIMNMLSPLAKYTLGHRVCVQWALFCVGCHQRANRAMDAYSQYWCEHHGDY